MKRNWLALSMLTMVTLFALACGSSDDSSLTVVDEVSITTPSDKSDLLTKAILGSKESNIVNDSATFTSVVIGSYTVYAGNASLTTSNTSNALYEARITVEADGDTVLRESTKTPETVQVNAVSTLFSLMSQQDPTTYNLIKSKIAGKSFSVTNGEVSGLAEVLEDDALAAVVDAATATVEMLVYAKSKGVDVDDALNSLATSSDNMENLNALLASTSSGNILSVVKSVAGDADFPISTTFTNVTGLTANNINSGSYTVNTVDTMKSNAAAALSGSGTVDSVTVGDNYHDGYSAIAGSFLIDTLAPVFKVTFTDNISKKAEVAGNITMSVTNTATNETKTITDNSTDIDFKWDGDDTLYLVFLSPEELSAGNTYSFTVSSNSTSVVTTNISQGTIQTYPITVTASQVPVDLGVVGYTGVDKDEISNLEFTVNSTTALASTSTEALALISSVVITSPAGVPTSYQDSDLDVTVNSDGSITVKLSSTANTSALTAGAYTFTVTLTGKTAGVDYNQTGNITLK